MIILFLECAAACATCETTSTNCITCYGDDVHQGTTCQANCDPGWFVEAGSDICTGITDSNNIQITITIVAFLELCVKIVVVYVAHAKQYLACLHVHV